MHYLGNKTRYLDPIVSAVTDLTPPARTVLDLFAGSGVVSRELAHYRPVLAVDIQAYSAVLASALSHPRRYDLPARRQIIATALRWLEQVRPSVSALLEYESAITNGALDDPQRFAMLVEHGSIASLDGTDLDHAHAKTTAQPALRAAGATITRYYGGVYFSYAQALDLDALLFAIGHGPTTPSDSTLVASILGTASDLVATVGSHFAQPTRLRDKLGNAKPNAVAQVVRARERPAIEAFERWLQKYSDLDPVKNTCTAITSDFRTVLNTLDDSVGAIYADPPYTRDHYSRFYHVLETIALGDDPGITLSPGTNAPSRGLYRTSRHQSPFSIRSEVDNAFDAVFSAAYDRNIPLVLSYSPQGGGTRARPETRLMTIERIVQRANEQFRSVEIRTIDDSSHSRFNRTELHGNVPTHAEVLVIARP
ncbi:DNA adenine methylase [Agromyces laixinhei]|uniref:DNA adenine methylase n=1 Tax=Agromyces laixinhei TaxID=2585717 RepID=UPI0018DBDDE5|nr:DNA adenine methylase [Agromyces laixinhei]